MSINDFQFTHSVTFQDFELPIQWEWMTMKKKKYIYI